MVLPNIYPLMMPSLFLINFINIAQESRLEAFYAALWKYVFPIFLDDDNAWFLPFFKAVKWTKISWGVSRISFSIILSVQFSYNGSWTQALQVMWLCLNFGSAWYGWTVITKEKMFCSPLGCCEWVYHCNFYYLFIMNAHIC